MPWGDLEGVGIRKESNDYQEVVNMQLRAFAFLPQANGRLEGGA